MSKKKNKDEEEQPEEQKDSFEQFVHWEDKDQKEFHTKSGSHHETIVSDTSIAPDPELQKKDTKELIDKITPLVQKIIQISEELHSRGVELSEIHVVNKEKGGYKPGSIRLDNLDEQLRNIGKGKYPLN